ncbi:helix-turn-helix domain-containing protein [Draconibacterium orientale]|uniref:helix-turn-helix domain-containing protein n=1 Tax=Draconibacterium orientale TaxID=1168034 RepID=UPI0029C085B8|nr:helix-turn-helix domain-containing protein [Draconibacterium orientale]
MENLLIYMTKEDFRNDIKNIVAETIRENQPEQTTAKDAEYLTRKETAAKLHISLVTLHRITNQGLIKSYKIKGRVLYRADEVTGCVTEQLKKHRR